MKVLLDACVLFPTVLREILFAVGREGLYAPLVSPRILEEWARAARRFGSDAEAEARAAAAMIGADFPRAFITPKPGTEARLWLPDPNDIHVLAAAIDGSADVLVTLNLKDFPRGEVQAWGLRAESPDTFLYDLWLAHPDRMEAAALKVHAKAQELTGASVALRPLLKRARLPRLGKALGL